MFRRVRARVDGNTEQAFTVIEFLVVIIIIGILLAIAVPSYLGFRDRAANNAMKANLREALPVAEQYQSDHGSYTGMDAAALAAIDSGLSPTLSVASATETTYCITDSDGSHTWSVTGPHPSNGDFKNNATCE